MLECPLPISQYPEVLLAHGGGGRLMQQLIARVFREAFDDLGLQALDDAALLPRPNGRLVFTTDSFVVRPLQFPGGDIGSMAVHGTVNDLATRGARPLYLSAGFILEEGLAMDTLWTLVQSMRRAALEADVRIVTGDTKVVDRGKGDGLYVNTAGVGVVEDGRDVGANRVQPGDRIVVSGDLGRHGIAIMAVREGLAFETEIESDSAPLNGLVADLFEAGIDVHALRDLTRGGLASAMKEMAQAAAVGITLDESAVPVREDVRGACEMLGLDPLYVANEGRIAAIVAAGEAERTVDVMQGHVTGSGAVQIGEVTADEAGQVRLKGLLGVPRILDLPSGEQLPRIC